VTVAQECIWVYLVRTVKTQVKKTSPKRRRPGPLFQELLKKFDNKPVKSSDIKLRIMNKFSSKTTPGRIRITRSRIANLEESSSTEEMKQRTP